MSDYNKAWRALNSVTNGDFVGDHLEELTYDQRIRVAEVMALLSISQELSALNPQNSPYRDPDGTWRNGWGIVAEPRREE